MITAAKTIVSAAVNFSRDVISDEARSLAYKNLAIKRQTAAIVIPTKA